MNNREAIRYINNSPTVKREEFTWVFAQETLHQSSVEKFRQAVSVLGGWIGEVDEFDVFPNRQFHPNYRKRYFRTVAAIPRAVCTGVA